MNAADLFPQDEQAFAELHFGGCRLGDARRTRRIVSYASSAARTPGASIPAMFGGRSAAFNALYDLLKHPRAGAEGLRSAHEQLVHRAMRSAKGRTVVIAEDGTDLSWTGHAAIEGLGFVSNARSQDQQGFHLHSALAMLWPQEREHGHGRPAVELLGLAAQLFHVRPRAALKGAKARKVRGGPEGQLWKKCGKAIGPAPHDVRFIRVCDRGADAFEQLQSCRELGHDFAIRACQNRVLLEEKERTYLLDAMREVAPFDGVGTLELRGREGRAGRTVKLRMAARTAVLRAPDYLPRDKRAPLEVTAVRVFEESWREGDKDALEWIVLCGHEVKTFAQAQRVARLYATRWIIEEFHKCLKSGMKVERLQLEHGDRLMAATAVLSIVALRLLDLRESARADPQAPAETLGLLEEELLILRLESGKPIMTRRDAVRAIASKGGFIGRKGDGEPGWQTLHIGYQLLQAKAEGYRMATEGRSQE